MIISREALLTEATSSGFRPEILEKVFHLIALLNSFGRHPFLKSRLALKGGTALNFFVFGLPRLSVDIDLNYIGAIDREAMLSERPMIEQAIQTMAERQALSVRRINRDHAAMTFFCRYDSPISRGGELKVDLNFMFRIPLWPVVPVDSHHIGTLNARAISILDINELSAGKLVALFARRTGRDLFDAHRLRSSDLVDPQCLRPAFVVYGAMNRRDWRSIRVSDVAFTEEYLQKDLLPLLRRSLLTDSGSTFKWRGQFVEETRQSLSSLLPFSEAEKEFFDRLLDHGEVKPSLLTEDEDLWERISLHPGLAWKALNVRNFKGK